MVDWRPYLSTDNATFWCLAFLLAAGLSSLIPPMQSPDEVNHIVRAYLISRGHLLLGAPPDKLTDPAGGEEAAAGKDGAENGRRNGGRIGGMVDPGLVEFAEAHLDIVRRADRRFSAEEKDHVSRLAWTGKQRFLALPGAGYYFPAVYIPQAMGLAIGQGLDLTIERSYQMARGLTLLACLSLLWLACRLMVPNSLVVAIVLLPMSLFQLSSPTIDGLTTSLSVLTLSLFLSFACPGRAPSRAAGWGLTLCIFVLATSRTHLLPLLALPFYLSYRYKSRRDFYLGCLLAAAVLGWVIFALYSTNDPRIARNYTTAELLMHYASHPFAFFSVVFNSVTTKDSFTFYQESFIGILGWLDTRLPNYFYPTLWTGLALCGLASVSISTLRQDLGARLLLVAVALASTGLIFLALLVTWTPHPASVVQGVQGRYFVVPMILLGYALSGFSFPPPPLRRWITRFFLAGFALTSLTALIMTLLTRYH